MVIQKLRNELRLLRLYALSSAVLLLVLAVAAFRPQANQHFKEIDVERLNIVEPGGRLRLVLSNTPHSPGLIEKGLPFGDTSMIGKRGGIIFYNDDGTEAGGIAVRGTRTPTAAVAHGGLSFDRFEQEDVVMLDYDEANGRHSQGLKIADRSNTPLKEILETLAPIQRMPAGAEKTAASQRWRARYGDHAGGVLRVFVGRDSTGSATLDLKDGAGQTRLRMLVDSLGAARIEFLDAGGRVQHTLR